MLRVAAQMPHSLLFFLIETLACLGDGLGDILPADAESPVNVLRVIPRSSESVSDNLLYPFGKCTD